MTPARPAFASSAPSTLPVPDVPPSGTAGSGLVALRLRDRWDRPDAGSPRRGRHVAIVAGSVVVHLLLLACVLVPARLARLPAEKEIAVEVVQDVPPQPKHPEPPLRRRQAEAAPDVQTKPAEPKPTEPKLTEPKPAEVKPPEVKPQPEPPKAPRRASPEPKASPRTTSPKNERAEAELKKLQEELAKLDAEQADVQARREAATVKSERHGDREQTFRPAALADVAEGGTDAASYEMLVFSSIEKAKGFDTYKGRFGAVNVRFTVDDGGRLASLEVETSSGEAGLDEQALALVRKAAPFPVPPAGAQRSFVAGITFGTPGGLVP